VKAGFIVIRDHFCDINVGDVNKVEHIGDQCACMEWDGDGAWSSKSGTPSTMLSVTRGAQQNKLLN